MCYFCHALVLVCLRRLISLSNVIRCFHSFQAHFRLIRQKWVKNRPICHEKSCSIVLLFYLLDDFGLNFIIYLFILNMKFLNWIFVYVVCICLRLGCKFKGKNMINSTQNYDIPEWLMHSYKYDVKKVLRHCIQGNIIDSKFILETFLINFWLIICSEFGRLFCVKRRMAQSNLVLIIRLKN